MVARLLFGAATMATAALGQGTFRDDRVSLDGAWKFELRRDNPLTTPGEVRFGPLTASSQALLLSVQGDRQPVRWNTSVPWPLAGTLLGAGPQAWGQQQIWKPHPDQKGPAWWQVDLGSSQVLTSVHVAWASKDRPAIQVETAVKRSDWKIWGGAQSRQVDGATVVEGPETDAHWVRLTFEPAQFGGTRRIQVFTRVRRDEVSRPWQPRVQRKWHDDLVSYEPGEFIQAGFNDTEWADIKVPGSWDQHKFSAPTWWQPDETVGHYRRKFTVPPAWRGKAVRLRFEGANNSAEVWVNGVRLGYHESGFTSFEYDVTPHLKPGGVNQIAVRIAKWTLTHEYDTDDAWYLGGLWRSVYLYALPGDRIDDYRIETTFDRQYKDAALRAELLLAAPGEGARAATAEGELLDREGRPAARTSSSFTLAGNAPQRVTLAASVPSPRKWTAETPYLYTLVLRLRVEGRVTHEFRVPAGFRQVAIQGNRLLLNGVPLKLRGVVTTRTNPTDSDEPVEKLFLREIRLLKEANINAIRSHTSQLEDPFLDLCDRYGIYIIPDVPNVWVNEQDFQPLADGVVQRAREVYERHKNRTSVIAWHVGNENGLTTAHRGGGKAALWLRENEKTRPVAVCQNRAGEEIGTGMTDMHYRPLTRPEFTKDAGVPVLFGEFHAVPEDIARLKDLGFVESWGRSFQLEWGEFMKRPWLAGGLICCWDDGSVNGDLGACQWGLIDSKRNAKPLLYYVRKTFAPVQLNLEDARVSGGRLKASLAVQNGFAFTDLGPFHFRWESGGRSGKWQHAVPPGQTLRFPVEAPTPTPASPLRIEVFDENNFSIQEEVFPLKGAEPPTAPYEWFRGGGSLHLTVRDRALVASDAAGRELLTLEGVSLKQGDRIAQDLPELRQTGFAATGSGYRADFQSPLLKGFITAAPDGEAFRISFRLQAEREVTLAEAGLRLAIASGDDLAIRRDSLWPSGPHPPFERTTLAALADTGSRREVFWFRTGSLLAAPIDTRFHLRGESGRRIVACAFLGAGDFLGKFDRDTIQRTLKPGDTLEGGFTLRAVKAE